MPLIHDAIDDFVATTQTKFMRHQWGNLVHDYPDFVATRLIAEKGHMEDGGRDISWLIKKGTAGNAQTTGLYRQVNINVDDNVVTAVAPWRFQVTGFGYDQREPMFQSDRETVVQLLKLRDVEARDDMVELQENLFWGCPVNTSDTDALWGVSYWVTKDASTTPNGWFGGMAPTNHTTVAGISPTDVARWRNWTGGYTTPNTDDLVKKIKRAMVNTNFKAPVPHKEVGFGKADRCMYADYDNVIEPLERLAETRNQNLGSDLAMYMGEVTIGRTPLKTSFWLQNNDSSYPVYGLDFGKFRPVIQRQLNMVRGKPQPVPGQDFVRRVTLHHGMNWTCVDRRRQFVISKA